LICHVCDFPDFDQARDTKFCWRVRQTATRFASCFRFASCLRLRAPDNPVRWRLSYLRGVRDGR
jgi:hypothetical protein